MRIRRYEESDEQAVIALWREVLPDSAPHNDPATAIRQKLAVDRELFLVAEAGAAVVGTVMGGYDGHRGWIYAVAVDPLHSRGRPRSLLHHQGPRVRRDHECGGRVGGSRRVGAVRQRSLLRFLGCGSQYGADTGDATIRAAGEYALRAAI